MGIIGKNSRSSYIAIGTVVLILALIPLFFADSPFYMRIITTMLAFSIYTIAFNIIFGHTNQLFLCMGALAGSAAYLSIVGNQELGVPPLLIIPLSIIIVGLIGAVFSYISVRRRLAVIFVGVVTIAFSKVFENVILGLVDYTGGETGIITRDLGLAFMRDEVTGYYVFLALLVGALFLYFFIIRSNIGLAFRAISDDEFTAELVGINVVYYKVLAAFIGSCLFGVAGVFYAFFNGYIGPAVYSMHHVDILVFMMLLFGGMGTLLGPIVGGGFFTVINTLMRPLGAINLFIYGLLLIFFFIFFREGVIVALQRAVQRLSSRPDTPASERHTRT